MGVNVLTLGERIKKLRKELDLTQQKLADRLGVKQNTIALIESGKRNTSDQLLLGICREFNVSEHWLRTGEGEMFPKKTPNEELGAFFGSVLAKGDDFQKRFLSVLMRMEPEDWHFLEDMIKRLSEEAKKAAPNKIEAADEIAPITSRKSLKEMSDAELHLELDRQLAEQREVKENPSAYWRGRSGTAAG